MLLVSLSLSASAVAQVTERRGSPSIVVGVGLVPPDQRSLLSRLAAHRELTLVEPRPVEILPRDALLAKARQAYGAMDFRRTLDELALVENRLIEGHLPSAERSARLADVELFTGACLSLTQDVRSAAERFVLARALAQDATLDPMFPPEVGSALAAARPGPTTTVELVVSPADSRAWVDGRRVGSSVQLPVGLHYIVIERADRRPQATITRIGRTTARLELSAAMPLGREQAAEALSSIALSDIEGIELSRVLGGPAWRLRSEGGRIEARRWAAADVTRPVETIDVPAPTPQALETALCAIERCAELATPASPPPRPLHKRAWFWGVVGTGAAIVVGGIIVGAVLGTRPRDYEAVVR